MARLIWAEMGALTNGVGVTFTRLEPITVVIRSNDGIQCAVASDSAVAPT
jgi:hypothetical protein